MSRQRAYRRWGRFNLVGLAGFAVQLGLLGLLTRRWHWHYLPATAVAMQVVILQNYVAHSRSTGAARPVRDERDRRLRLLRYQAAKMVSLGLNLLVTAIFVSQARLSPEIANVLAVGVCSVFNYAAADCFVFRGSPEPATAPAARESVGAP